MKILAVLEQTGGVWNRMSFETLAAAQQIAGESGGAVSAAVVGDAGELTSKKLDKAYAVSHELLKDYTPDGYALALRQLIESVQPDLVLFPHTYQVRDFLPKLATSMDRVAVSDVVGHRASGGAFTLVRQLFQGKINADVRFTSGSLNF